jgi:hypothetical protein
MRSRWLGTIGLHRGRYDLVILDQTLLAAPFKFFAHCLVTTACGIRIATRLRFGGRCIRFSGFLSLGHV